MSNDGQASGSGSSEKKLDHHHKAAGKVFLTAAEKKRDPIADARQYFRAGWIDRRYAQSSALDQPQRRQNAFWHRKSRDDKAAVRGVPSATSIPVSTRILQIITPQPALPRQDGAAKCSRIRPSSGTEFEKSAARAARKSHKR